MLAGLYNGIVVRCHRCVGDILDRACTGHVSISNCSMELIRKK